MHETCWGGGAAVSCAIGGVSRERLGMHRWLLSCVRVCGPYRMTARIIDEQLVLLRAYARIVLCQATDWRDWYGCRAQERGLCYSRGVGIAAAQRCRVRKLADCAGARQRIGGTGVVACVQARGLCLNANDEAELARRLLCAHTRELCCPYGAPVPPALRLPCVQARIVLATGNQLRAACCVTVRASACRARSSAWMVEAGVCPATPTSPGPSVRRAQAHTRRRAGNGPRRVHAPTPWRGWRAG